MGSTSVISVVNSSTTTRQYWVRPSPPVILIIQKIKPRANKRRIKQRQTPRPKMRTRRLPGNAINRLIKLSILLKKASWVAKRTQWTAMRMIRVQTRQKLRVRHSNAKFAHKTSRQTSYWIATGRHPSMHRKFWNLHRIINRGTATKCRKNRRSWIPQCQRSQNSNRSFPARNATRVLRMRGPSVSIFLRSMRID